MGVRFDRVPDGTFYAWGNVANLPAPLNDGMGLFRDYVRFSFGPSLENIERALTHLEGSSPLRRRLHRAERPSFSKPGWRCSHP